MCVICDQAMTSGAPMAQGFGEEGVTLMGFSLGQAATLHPESQWVQAPAADARLAAALGHHRQARWATASTPTAIAVMSCQDAVMPIMGHTPQARARRYTTQLAP